MKNGKRIFSMLLVLCMVIPMCLITVGAETTIKYDFYYDELTWEGKGLAKVLSDENTNQATLKSAYDSGKINFLPVAHAGISVPYLHSKDHYQNGTTVANTSLFNGVKINSKSIGDWVAIKIKNPGDGCFKVTVNFPNSINSARGCDVYILSGVSESAASIENALTNANLYGNVDLKSPDYQPYGQLMSSTLETTLNARASDGDYIVVFKTTKCKTNKTENTSSTQAYIWLTGLTLTKTEGTVPAPTTPAPTTPAPTTPVTPDLPGDDAYRLWDSSLSGLSYNDKGEITLSTQMELLNNLYAAGTLDVVPFAEKSGNTALLNYGAASNGQFPFNGIRLQKAAVGDYIALKFRSPGAGVYSISLDNYYLNANNAARMAVYMLPGDTAVEAVEGKLVDSNMIGYADVLSNNTSKATCTVNITSGIELEANAQYILVFRFDKDNYQPETGRVDVMMTGLTFGEGFIGVESPFDPVSGDVALSEAIKSASVYKGCTGVNPANGHNLMYLMFKGSMLLVYDLDAKELVDREDNIHSTPFDTCFDPEGNLWITGTGTFIYKYNPTTGEGKKYSFAKTDFFGTSTNSYGGIYVDGYVYFGYAGAFGRVNTTTGEVQRITEKIQLDTSVKSDAKYLAYGGMYHKDGYLYTTLHGDENGDQIYTSAVIKFEIATNKVVDWVDVSFATRIPKEEAAHGISYLSKVNDILIGTFSNRKPGVYVDISGDEMKLVEKFGNLETCFINRVSEAVNGKMYAAGYVDNEATTKCIYEIDLATNQVTRLGDIVYMTAINAKGSGVTVQWDDNLPGYSIVTYQNNSATGMVDLYFYSPTTMETVILEGVTAGQGTGQTLRTLTADDTGRYIYVGAYGTNLITQYDTVTGENKTYIGTDHQTDSLCWYDGMLYMGNYGGGTITQLDVATGDVTPYFTLTDTVFRQERMFGITAGDNKVFCGTIPDESRTGGVLVWFDLEEKRTYVAGGPNPEDVYYADYSSFVVWRNYVTGEVETFDLDGDGVYDYDILVDDKGDDDPTNDVFKQVINGLIPTQCPNDLVYKDGLIYGCTTKHNGDAVATKFDGNALLFVYDLNEKKLLTTCDVGETISGLNDPKVGWIDYIDAIAADPYEDGKFWGVICDTLFSFTYDRAANKMSVKEELSLAKGNGYRHATSTWHSRTILFDGDYMYVGFHNMGLWMVNTADPKQAYKISVYNPAGGMARGQDGNIYYISNQDGSKPITELCVFKIAEGTQPVVAASVQKLIEALPETVTAENVAQVLSVYAMYNDLRDGAKAMVTNADKLTSAANAALKVQAEKVDSMIDAIGTVTLEAESAIVAARNAYEALSQEAKAQVTKLSVLEAAEARLAELKANPGSGIWLIVAIAAAVVVVAAAVVVVIIIRKKKSKAE